MKHELKILPAHFRNKRNGDMPVDIRHNGDRGFQKGDLVKFREWSPDTGYTGEGMFCRITYVTNYRQQEDMVVFCTREVPDAEWAINN